MRRRVEVVHNRTTEQTSTKPASVEGQKKTRIRSRERRRANLEAGASNGKKGFKYRRKRTKKGQVRNW